MKIQELLAPVELDTFFKEYWEKKPLHLTGHAADRFKSLFSLGDLDHLLSVLPQETRVGLIKNDLDKPDQPGAKSTAGTNICDLFDNFSDGNTLIVNGMHKHWPPIRNLCTGLSKETGFKTQVNMYVTPKQSTGFSPHWDDHEVMILQVSGEKFWRLYGNGPSLPRKSQHDPIAALRQRTLQPGDPTQELTLRPGDLLYIPRGCVHNATATDSTSVHLTLGINTISWEELLIAGIKQLSKKDPAFRDSIPAGILLAEEPDIKDLSAKCKDLLKTAAGNMEVNEGLELLSQSLVRSLEAEPSQHFLNLDHLEDVQLDTKVRRRGSGIVQFVQEADYVALIWPGYFQQGPEKMVLAFAYIAKTPKFKVGDIPGWYSDDEKVLAVRHLIKKGFLEPDPD